jgi:hypothetical protein
MPALRERFQRDGYLYLKNILPAEDVLKARANTLLKLADLRPDVFPPGVSPLEGTAAEGTSAIGLLSKLLSPPASNDSPA